MPFNTVQEFIDKAEATLKSFGITVSDTGSVALLIEPTVVIGMTTGYVASEKVFYYRILATAGGGEQDKVRIDVPNLDKVEEKMLLWFLMAINENPRHVMAMEYKQFLDEVFIPIVAKQDGGPAKVSLLDWLKTKMGSSAVDKANVDPTEAIYKMYRTFFTNQWLGSKMTQGRSTPEDYLKFFEDEGGDERLNNFLKIRERSVDLDPDLELASPLAVEARRVVGYGLTPLIQEEQDAKIGIVSVDDKVQRSLVKSIATKASHKSSSLAGAVMANVRAVDDFKLGHVLAISDLNIFHRKVARIFGFPYTKIKR